MGGTTSGQSGARPNFGMGINVSVQGIANIAKLTKSVSELQSAVAAHGTQKTGITKFVEDLKKLGTANLGAISVPTNLGQKLKGVAEALSVLTPAVANGFVDFTRTFNQANTQAFSTRLRELGRAIDTWNSTKAGQLATDLERLGPALTKVAQAMPKIAGAGALAYLQGGMATSGAAAATATQQGVALRRGHVAAPAAVQHVGAVKAPTSGGTPLYGPSGRVIKTVSPQQPLNEMFLAGVGLASPGVLKNLSSIESSRSKASVAEAKRAAEFAHGMHTTEQMRVSAASAANVAQSKSEGVFYKEYLRHEQLRLAGEYGLKQSAQEAAQQANLLNLSGDISRAAYAQKQPDIQRAMDLRAYHLENQRMALPSSIALREEQTIAMQRITANEQKAQGFVYSRMLAQPQTRRYLGAPLSKAESTVAGMLSVGAHPLYGPETYGTANKPRAAAQAVQMGALLAMARNNPSLSTGYNALMSHPSKVVSLLQQEVTSGQYQGKELKRIQDALAKAQAGGRVTVAELPPNSLAAERLSQLQAGALTTAAGMAAEAGITPISQVNRQTEIAQLMKMSNDINRKLSLPSNIGQHLASALPSPVRKVYQPFVAGANLGSVFGKSYLSTGSGTWLGSTLGLSEGTAGLVGGLAGGAVLGSAAVVLGAAGYGTMENVKLSNAVSPLYRQLGGKFGTPARQAAFNRFMAASLYGTQMGYTTQQSQQALETYTGLAGTLGGAPTRVLRTIAQTARGMGVGIGQTASLFGTVAQVQGNLQPKQFAQMLGKAVADAQMQGRYGEFFQALQSTLQGISQTLVAPSATTTAAELATISAASPAMRGTAAARLLGQVNSGIMSPGFGAAGQLFTMRALAQPGMSLPEVLVAQMSGATGKLPNGQTVLGAYMNYVHRTTGVTASMINTRGQPARGANASKVDLAELFLSGMLNLNSPTEAGILLRMGNTTQASKALSQYVSQQGPPTLSNQEKIVAAIDSINAKVATMAAALTGPISSVLTSIAIQMGAIHPNKPTFAMPSPPGAYTKSGGGVAASTMPLSYQSVIKMAATKNNVNPNLLASLVSYESGGNLQSISINSNGSVDIGPGLNSNYNQSFWAKFGLSASSIDAAAKHGKAAVSKLMSQHGVFTPKGTAAMLQQVATLLGQDMRRASLPASVSGISSAYLHRWQEALALYHGIGPTDATEISRVQALFGQMQQQGYGMPPASASTTIHAKAVTVHGAHVHTGQLHDVLSPTGYKSGR